MDKELIRFNPSEKPYESLQVKAFNNAIEHQGEREITLDYEQLEIIIMNAILSVGLNNSFNFNDIKIITDCIVSNSDKIIVRKY